MPLTSHINDFVSTVKSYVSRYYWNDYLHWRPRDQLVYEVDKLRPEFIAFQVPYLCAALPYDGLGYWDYPSRVGWKVHRFDRGCHRRCPPGNCISSDRMPEDVPYGLQTHSISRMDDSIPTVQEKIAFLQAWLFFGALAEVCSICGLSLELQDTFISKGMVNTAALNGLPMRLYHSSQKLGIAGSMKLKSQLRVLTRHVQLMITRGDEREDEHEYTFTQCEVLCSIYVLLRILSLTTLCHAPHWNLDPNDDMYTTLGDVTSDWKPEGLSRMRDLTLAKLFQRGWCPSEIHLLQGDDVFIFTSFLERPLEARRDHSNCLETRCKAYQIVEEEYKTAHTAFDCTCEFVSVIPEHLRDALAANKIPKIIVSEDLQLSVIDDKSHPYIAISHVWADGLGNPFDNSLPRCQLRRLRHLMRDLCKTHKVARFHRLRSIALWIDTLCIPVAPQFKEYRKLAIRLLARTFHESTAVLVLDRELSLFNSRSASILELGIRIMCSGWMKRLWTLQEASLAIESADNRGRLYFQMFDGPVQWKKLTETFDYKPMKPQRRPPKHDARHDNIHDVKSVLLFEIWVTVSMINRLPSVRELQSPRWDSNLEMISEAAQTRSTSKAEDEPICLASLLGLDLADVLSVQTASERMIRFYLLLHEIPIAIIFAQLGVANFRAENLEQAPFRWAPKSLLTLELPMNIHMAYASQRFAEQNYHLNGVCEPDGFHFQHNGLLFLDTERTPPRKKAIIEITSNQGGNERYVLVWLGDIPEHLPRHMALILETGICSNVAIVSVESRKNDEHQVEICGTLIGHGFVKTMEEPDAEGSILQSTLTSLEQKWCLT